MDAYKKLLDARLQSALDKSIDRAKTLQGQLSSASIAIFPANHSYDDWFRIDTPHFWGMAAAVLFLSLGAPFWFNLLKHMTQLKSVVATKSEGAASTPGREPATRSPVPTAIAATAILPPLPDGTKR